MFDRRKACDVCGSTDNGFIPGRTTCVKCQEVYEDALDVVAPEPAPLPKRQVVVPPRAAHAMRTHWPQRDLSLNGPVLSEQAAALRVMGVACGLFEVSYKQIRRRAARGNALNASADRIRQRDARFWFIWAARELTAASLDEIAALVRCTRSAVCSALNTLRGQHAADSKLYARNRKFARVAYRQIRRLA